MALDQLTKIQSPIKPNQIEEKWLPQIIIVDDDLELLEELKDALSSNYHVETLSDSAKAFDMVYELKPDLIVLDIKMRPKSGFQLANEFTNFERTKFIPIIFITGFYIEQEHPLMRLFDMKHIMNKPFNLNQFFEKIEAVLKESKASKQDEEDDSGRPKKRW